MVLRKLGSLRSLAITPKFSKFSLYSLSFADFLSEAVRYTSTRKEDSLHYPPSIQNRK